MKKLIFIILLVGSVQAQDNMPVGRQLDSLRTACFKTLGEGIADTATVDLAINIALYQVCNDFPALEKIDTVFITKTGEGGALNDDYSRFIESNPIWKIIGDTLRIALKPFTDTMGIDLPNIDHNKQVKNSPMSPDYYMERARRLIVHPKFTETAADSFLVFYYAYNPMLEAGTDSVLIEGIYISKILDYAFMWLLSTSDRYQEASAAMLRYNPLLGMNR